MSAQILDAGVFYKQENELRLINDEVGLDGLLQRDSLKNELSYFGTSFLSDEKPLEQQNFDKYLAAVRKGETALTPFTVGSFMKICFNVRKINGLLHQYKKSVWTDDEQEIRNQLQKVLGDLYSQKILNETISWLKDDTNIEYSSKDQTKVAFKNGVYDFLDGKIEPFNPIWFLKRQIPHKINPFAPFPEKFHKFLTECLITENDTLETEEKKLTTAYEIIAFCFLSGYPVQKVVMLVGEGANGKSVFLSVLKTILGKENVCSVSLQDLVFKNFSKAALYNKFANIYADLPKQALREASEFRILTGGDTISADRKYRDFVTFENSAKLIFSTNKPPAFQEDLFANWRRMFLFEFPNIIPIEKQNRNLAKELEKEIEGIIFHSLKFLPELYKRGEFSYTLKTEQIREQYIRLSNPAQAFFMDCLVEDQKEFIPKSLLYETFCDYCREQGLEIYSEKAFFSNLLKTAKVREYRPQGETGQRQRCLAGLKFKIKVDTLQELEKQEIENEVKRK